MFAALVADPEIDRREWTLRQLAVLQLVATTHAGRSVKDIAQALDVAGPIITRALDKLEVIEAVRRVEDRDDRRRISVSVTAAGRRLLARIESHLPRAA